MIKCFKDNLNFVHLAMLWEKVVVTAREFLGDRNINDSKEMNDIMFQMKQVDFDWGIQFSAASLMAEIVWKIAIGKENTQEMRRLDKLFSPSPIATHANFRGCNSYKTGTLPEKGAIVIWRRGNSWQGHMAIVSDVSENKMSFDVIEARVLIGSEGNFLQLLEQRGKMVGLPFKDDKLNIIGFVYPPNREIA